MTDMTQHFLADYHNFGEPTAVIEKHLTIPIRRVPHVAQWTGDPPFLVFGCTWHHRNSQGPLTQEKFDADLAGAIADFARVMNSHEEFLAYPITHIPPSTVGIAYHDWCGAAYPFDIRAMIVLDEAIPCDDEKTGGGPESEGYPTIETGLTFNLLTLISKDTKPRGS